jgi:AcrR family transcriptional regulator
VSTITGVRARKKRETREQLAFAAVELFAERGPRQIRVEHICERAGVGRATFFRYFDSKESAFVQGIYNGRLGALLDALAARPAEETQLHAVRNAMRQAFADWREHRDLLLLAARIRADHPPARARAATQHDEWRKAIAELIAKRMHTEPTDLRPKLVAGIAMTALGTATERWLDDPDHLSADACLTEAFDAVDTVCSWR